MEPTPVDARRLEFLRSDLSSSVPPIRLTLFEAGPFAVWRKLSPPLSPAHRKRIRKLLDRAKINLKGIGSRDPDLRKAMGLPLALVGTGLDILDSFDRAWAEYHRPAQRPV